jgi:hypothetical protein
MKNFPFGQPLTRVYQLDRKPKKAFVLGVYASAVHARWIDKNGKQKVAALAVASEPSIFWTGKNAKNIISEIKIPEQLGKLTIPANNKLNGSSGLVLDKLFLKPLQLDRKNSWLCDLLPESRTNIQQIKALDNHYTLEIINKYNLLPATVPYFNEAELNSEKRREEILSELEESKATMLILLGDLPIKWFLRFINEKYFRLSQFGDKIGTYGRVHNIIINNNLYDLIPLCHPRQAARLGFSNTKWGRLHENWVKQKSL